MPKPIFCEVEKVRLSRFLDGEMPHPTTPFEARAYIERAAARISDCPNGALYKAAFAVWADDVDPPGAVTSRAAN